MDARARRGINAQQAADLTGHTLAVSDAYRTKAHTREIPDDMIPGEILRSLVADARNSQTPTFPARPGRRI